MELQELRRRLVGVRQLGMSALDDERPHRQPDAEPQQRAQRITDRADRQGTPGVLDASAHHELGDDVWLARGAEHEHHEPGQRPHHAERAKWADGFRVVRDERRRDATQTAVNRGHRRNEHEHGGHDHDPALHQIGVHRRQHATGDAVEHQHRARDRHAGDERDLRDERDVVQHVEEDRRHRLDLGGQIPDDTQQDGDGGQQSCPFAAIAGRHRVRE